jgi:glycosyltransferase involved in cell wall biosynthesis
VVAYAAGGALDTVVPGTSGVFFREQTPAALAAAVHECDLIPWDQQQLRRHAERFREERFRERMMGAIENVMGAQQAKSARDFHNQRGVRHRHGQGREPLGVHR